MKSCNVLGVGPLRGKWQTTSLKWLVEKYVKERNQRPYILRMSEFENFCTVFDLDFRFKEETVIPHAKLIEHASTLRDIIKTQTNKTVRILITRKPKLCYEKELKKEGRCWASGCHLYILKHRFTQSEATLIRKKFEPVLKGLNFVEDVIDDKVFPIGKNGVYMIGSAKPDCEFAHCPLCVVGETVEKVIDVTPETVVRLYCDEICAEDCYISSVVMPTIVKKKIKTKKKPYKYAAVVNDLKTIEEDWDFNLVYFFDLIKFFEEEVSDLDTWKLIVYFFKESNIPTTALANALNEFYQPGNPQENFNLLADRHVRNNAKIYKIKRHGIHELLVRLEVQFDYEKLFFPQKFHFISDVYAACDKTIVWKDLGSFQRKIQTVFSEIQDHSTKPILHYKYKSHIGITHSKTPQFRRCHSTNEFADKYVYFMNGEPGERPECKKLRRIVQEMVMCEEFHVYKRIITYPFFGENPIEPGSLNIWRQPDLYFYKAVRVVDWTKHAIFEHLKVVMCKNDDYKFKYLQTYIALKIQQPGRRVEKCLNIVNDTTGCGKTSFFHLMTALLGNDMTFELTDIKQLNDKFNAHLLGKLLILVDDIDKLTKSQQDTLKTVTTQKNMKIERKGIDSVKEKCFFDTITTCNNPDDFWISKEDRRNEIIHVSDVRKQNDKNKPFWDEFYTGLLDLDVMKPAFVHFSNFPIELDIRSKACRFDQQFLDRRICDSLPSSIEFIRNLFENVDFIRWTACETHVFGRGYIWISPGYLYKVFTEYLNNVGSRLRPQQKKFISTLAKLGIVVQRRRCKEVFSGQFRCLELSPRTIQDALQPVYGEVEIFQGGFEKFLAQHRDKLSRDELFPQPGLIERGESKNEG